MFASELREDKPAGWLPFGGKEGIINSTKIEWVKNPDGSQGYTWNPITGCINHVNGLCKGGNFPCYAYKLADGRLKQRYLANTNLAPVSGGFADIGSKRTDPFSPRFWEDRMDDPFLSDRNICIKRHTRGQRRTPRGIFVCDMGELFGDWLPRKWQEEIHLTILFNPQHRFYLLTKQPQNLIKFSPYPENCWVGVTATDTRLALEACLKLRDIQAPIKYLSLEPMLHSINLPFELLKICGINWIIIGQCTPVKQATMPEMSWIQNILVAASNAGNIPVFMKDNLLPLFPDNSPLIPCHNELLMMNHSLCENCQHDECDRCGVIWKLRQEMPRG